MQKLVSIENFEHNSLTRLLIEAEYSHIMFCILQKVFRNYKSQTKHRDEYNEKVLLKVIPLHLRISTQHRMIFSHAFLKLGYGF